MLNVTITYFKNVILSQQPCKSNQVVLFEEHSLNSKDEIKQSLCYLLRVFLKVGFSIFQKIKKPKQVKHCLLDDGTLGTVLVKIFYFHYKILPNTLCVKYFKVLIFSTNYTSVMVNLFLFAGEENNCSLSSEIGPKDCVRLANTETRFPEESRSQAVVLLQNLNKTKHQ